MKRNICRVLVVMLLLTTSLVIANLPSTVKTVEERCIVLEVDKTNANVGDIILAKVNVYNIDKLAGYQVNIKYDPEVLQAVDVDSGAAFTSNTKPKNGNLINNADLGIIDAVSNDVERGILNFGRTYTYLDDYRGLGDVEEIGTLAVIGFKVLEQKPTSIRFENTPTMPTGVIGTMLFNWDGDVIANYSVVQPDIINNDNSGTSEGYIELDLNQNVAQVGDIIRASVKVNNIDNFAGYQVNIKYDPEVLQAVNPNTGEVLSIRSMPLDGNILVNSEYGVISAANNDIQRGLLNFAKSYTYLDDYKNSGDPHSTGIIAEIGFKAINIGNTNIVFEDTSTMMSGIQGTMLYNWNGERISGYNVKNSPNVTITSSGVSPVVPPVTDGYIEMTFDKNTARVGEIIEASININNISNFMGYQINIKYDPTVLEAVDTNTGVAFGRRTMPANGTILVNENYGVIEAVNNNIDEGIINFAKTYSNAEQYKLNGGAEESGTIGVIGFRVLKEESTSVSFENTVTMPGGLTGTLLFNWDGNQVLNYSVIQPQTINSGSHNPGDDSGNISGEVISMVFDKKTASIGDIVTASININNINNFAGYQVSIKYDPEVLEPINAVTGEAYGRRTMPESGSILVNSTFSPLTVASHDLSEGRLSFGKTYTELSAYRTSGTGENSGTLANISFRVLKTEKTLVSFEETSASGASIFGTLLYDWNGYRLSNYSVLQPGELN
ncbi:UNVERIFIED_CONTAM: cohesin domain-containing protein [Acetivibrio alkalicellulosi]